MVTVFPRNENLQSGKLSFTFGTAHQTVNFTVPVVNFFTNTLVKKEHLNSFLLRGNL